jgi:hypothetical protein
MYSFVFIRPSIGTTESCIHVNKSVISTREKYIKRYEFSRPEQIVFSSPSSYTDTMSHHIRTLVQEPKKKVITIVGFGASGSGKTYNLLGMDSYGIHNPNSIIYGIINDLSGISIISLEITQVYCNVMSVLHEMKQMSITQIKTSLFDTMKKWKQHKFSTHNSSRAHLCIRLLFSDTEIRIVDTAGYERANNERDHMETVNINKDMLALKECIRNNNTITYRQRVLTHLLFRISNETEHIFFMIGTIDPYANQMTIVANTLNYLSVLGCAELTVVEKCKHTYPTRPKAPNNQSRITPKLKLSPEIVSYIQNQKMLLDTITKFDYKTQYREVLKTINDQQMLASNIILNLITDICNTHKNESKN